MDRILIIDFDNTMFNTELALAQITIRVLREFKIELPLPCILDRIGRTTEERMFAHGLRDTNLKKSIYLFKIFHSECFETHLCEMIPGLEEFLKRYKQYKIIIVSQSPAIAIRKVLMNHNLTEYICRIISVPDLGLSNKKEVIINLKLDWSTTQFVIGDSIDDMELAKFIGKPFYCIENVNPKLVGYEKQVNFTSYYEILEYLKGNLHG